VPTLRGVDPEEPDAELGLVADDGGDSVTVADALDSGNEWARIRRKGGYGQEQEDSAQNDEAVADS
jgi:hypothetical protein